MDGHVVKSGLLSAAEKVAEPIGEGSVECIPPHNYRTL